MKKLLLYGIFGILINITSACDSEESDSEIYESNYNGCGTHNGQTLYEGPEGGCYYYNGNGNKTYVDRSECNC
ncbi:hypothetical protein Aeqsu_0186 [Aequorivita sublithincola DSM 14238]|uniref:Lipoprotein n=1 Tax=Aequorivita sublithincola (strain DSM 14238 / LMG 21431 / ACAM 643 / 9-3) TaxID=746697 RepID=I3YRU4_AEQSU|nr:hypothetical protein [Aequorivita sublithincola]AFL79712.1 hypothetical protein Aeqsu_0186 [Aequorivita sublithincola DSM 14238]